MAGSLLRRAFGEDGPALLAVFVRAVKNHAKRVMSKPQGFRPTGAPHVVLASLRCARRVFRLGVNGPRDLKITPAPIARTTGVLTYSMQQPHAERSRRRFR